MAPGAEQPSDEGLAFMAEIEGQPAPRETREAREPRGRGRGPGRWRRSAPLPDEFRDPSALFPTDEGVQDLDGFVSPQEAHIPAFTPETESAAPTAEAVAPEPPVVSEAPETAAEAAPAAAAEIEAPTVEAAKPEPAPEAAPAADEAAPAPGVEIEPLPAPARKTTEVVITEADPAAPKKGGWWQKVRPPIGE